MHDEKIHDDISIALSRKNPPMMHVLLSLVKDIHTDSSNTKHELTVLNASI